MLFYGPELEIIIHMSYLLVCYVYRKIFSESQPVTWMGQTIFMTELAQSSTASADTSYTFVLQRWHCVHSWQTLHDMYRPTLQSCINVQSCEFEWGLLQLWIYAVVLCQLGNVIQWTERVQKFLPEVMATIYACNGWGDVMSCACETTGSGDDPLENATWTHKMCKTPQNIPSLNNILSLGS
jgi:hypothetical protein